ncbi:3-phosphoshikimate 1-carboxyvinyltransferase [Agriterribacter sp.]|uniref:3-phosphoshikimate 1-carboxyvinyltransferase n=1 Tax=Agriterribacter sp. TaxID=2821509 RepID=UPI002C2F0FF1|nr:3-phosphoshikimate 1-carboxyvinyltransferase [Agriterribacter sp.]HRO48325.1 3-phosphoshikimate 1-carboxyvinyltransferase [Agriterribacter sp.]HRQ17189.1 3-phosphoshikimate 1-carboxyvinyltransferase [Agriterribacter sp.]
MIATIQPSVLSDTVQAPASKSAMQRACAAALISGGKSIIYNPGHSNDDKAALQVITALGAKVNTRSDGAIETDSSGVNLSSPGISQNNALTINCGESGLGIRMFAPVIALSRLPVTIKGEGSLLSRPMDFFDEIFPRLNVTVSSNNGRLPVVLSGPLQPRNIEIDGSLSSQFLTGLLMAYAAAEARDVTIKVNNLKSRPYIDLTLKVMQLFGLKTPENNNYKAFYFDQSPARLAPSETTYTVEGDWSGGAFLLVAGAIAGEITVRGLDPNSAQADKKILEALQDAGAGTVISDEGIRLVPGALKAFTFDATDCPDLFPPLVALAAYSSGTTVIKGVSRLAHKESNRGLTLQDEFGKMGLQIDLQDDIMHVHGGKGLKGATVHSRHDHRIAMACAVAALRAEGATTIEEAGAISKSYPDFYEDLVKLGANVKIKQQSAHIQ